MILQSHKTQTMISEMPSLCCLNIPDLVSLYFNSQNFWKYYIVLHENIVHMCGTLNTGNYVQRYLVRHVYNYIACAPMGGDQCQITQLYAKLDRSFIWVHRFHLVLHKFHLGVCIFHFSAYIFHWNLGVLISFCISFSIGYILISFGYTFFMWVYLGYTY